MSVYSDLQSALRAAGSAVGGALSAVGRAVGGALASLASSTADKASSAYSVAKDTILIAAKSYFNGVGFIFQKLKGQETNQGDFSLNLIEKILHSTISCAWVFALLASIIYHSSLSTIKLLKFAWVSDSIANNSTEYRFSKYSIIGLPGILLGACLGSLSYIIKQNYDNFLRFSSKTLDLLDKIYKDPDLNSNLNSKEGKAKSSRYGILSLIVSTPALCLALCTGFFLTLYKFCIQNYYGFIEALKYTATYNFYIIDSNDVHGISKSNAKVIAKILSFPGILVGILTGSAWQIFNNSVKIGVFLASQIINSAYHKQTINLPSKQMHIVAKVLGFPLGLPLGIASGIFGFFTVGLVRNNIYAAKYIYYKLKSTINSSDDTYNKYPKGAKNFIRLYGFGFLGAIIALTGVIVSIVIPKFITNNYKAFKYVFIKLMLSASEAESISISDVASPGFNISQKILSLPGAVLGVAIASPISFILAIVLNTYKTAAEIYNSIEIALKDKNDNNSLDTAQTTIKRSALQKLRLYSFGFLGVIIGFVGALSVEIIPRFVMYNYNAASYIFSKIINMSYHEELISGVKKPEFRLIQKILSLPGTALSIIISSPISLILSIVLNTYKVTANLYDNANEFFSDHKINTHKTDSLKTLQKLRLYSFGFIGFIFGSALVFFNIVIPKFITNNYKAFKYVFIKLMRSTSEAESMPISDVASPGFNISQKILSLPGTVLGVAIASPISFILAIVLNTYKTATEIYNSIEIALKDKDDNNSLDTAQTTIKRSALQKLRLYSFGCLGFIIGFVGALAVEIIPRFVMYNYNAASYIFSKIINMSYHEELISEVKKPAFRLIQKILSLPGTTLSIIISSPISFILAIALNTYKTASDIYNSIKNSFSSHDIQKTQYELKNTNFTKLQKLRLYTRDL